MLRKPFEQSDSYITTYTTQTTQFNAHYNCKEGRLIEMIILTGINCLLCFNHYKTKTAIADKTN